MYFFKSVTIADGSPGNVLGSMPLPTAGVGDEAEVMGAAAEEAVGDVGIAVKVEAAEFEISGAGREGTAADIEHGGSVGAASPDEIDGDGFSGSFLMPPCT